MKHARTLFPQEFKRVVAVASIGKHSHRNILALQLSYFAGLRAKEIALLTWGDVLDFDQSIKDIVYLEANQTKGRQGRKIVFNTALKTALKHYMTSSPASQVEPAMPLIVSQKGSFFSPNSLCQLFLRLYSNAGLKRASSHSGRRTFITNLAHKGVSAKVLMDLAGHQHLSTTQRYIESNEHMMLEAANLLKN